MALAGRVMQGSHGTQPAAQSEAARRAQLEAMLAQQQVVAKEIRQRAVLERGASHEKVQRPEPTPLVTP